MQITLVPVVPPIAIMLAKLPVVEQYDVSSIKTVVCAAAPLSRDVIETLTNKFGWQVMQGFGMTECFASHLTRENDDLKLIDKAGSIGILLPFFEAKVF